MADDYSGSGGGMANIAAMIREKALANGVDPDVLLRIAKVESNLNPGAANSASSAKGLFQFTKGTWGQYGDGNPLDPGASADAGARFTAANANGLRAAGVEPTPGASYLAHFAGLGGATKLLSADPSARAGDVLGAAAVKANPWLAGMSVADVQAWADRKMGGSGSASAPPPATPTAASGSLPPAGAGPSQTGAVPVATENTAPTDDALLQALQAMSQPAEQQTPAAPSIPINFPVPPGLQRARALALAMGKASIA